MDTEYGERAASQPLVRSGADGRQADFAMGDWLTLLAAVTGRLRMTAARQSTVTNDDHALDASGRLRADVLDCVAALDQLHVALSRAQRPFARHPGP